MTYETRPRTSAASGVSQASGPGPSPTTNTVPGSPDLSDVAAAGSTPGTRCIAVRLELLALPDARPAASARRSSPGTTTSDMYGTCDGSTCVTGRRRSPSRLARSTYQARSSRPAWASASRTFAKVRPSFMMTAASVSARRRAISVTGRVPGSTVSTSSCRHNPVDRPADAAETDVTPGTTWASKRSASRSWTYIDEPKNNGSPSASRTTLRPASRWAPRRSAHSR